METYQLPTPKRPGAIVTRTYGPRNTSTLHPWLPTLIGSLGLYPPTSMAVVNPSRNVSLEIRYDISLKEIGITFESTNHAYMYQGSNPEGRILHDQSSRTVWLPMSPAMTSFRSSSMGMAIMFSGVTAARDWARRSILAFEITVGQESGAIIKKEWDRREMETKLLDYRSNRMSLTPSEVTAWRHSQPLGRPSPPPDVVGLDDVYRARGSSKPNF